MSNVNGDMESLRKNEERHAINKKNTIIEMKNACDRINSKTLVLLDVLRLFRCYF